MKSVNPRVSVTLKPSTDATLSRLSKATKQSKSALVAELLEQSEPTLERLATLLEAAQTATQQARERMASNLEEAQSKLEEHIGLAKDLFEEKTNDLIGEMEQIGRRKAKGAGGRTHGSAATSARPDAPSPGSTPGASRPPRLTGGSHPTTPGKGQGRKTAAKPSPARKRGGNA